jgi:hypothetical protein
MRQQRLLRVHPATAIAAIPRANTRPTFFRAACRSPSPAQAFAREVARRHFASAPRFYTGSSHLPSTEPHHSQTRREETLLHVLETRKLAAVAGTLLSQPGARRVAEAGPAVRAAHEASASLYALSCFASAPGSASASEPSSADDSQPAREASSSLGALVGLGARHSGSGGGAEEGAAKPSGGVEAPSALREGMPVGVSLQLRAAQLRGLEAKAATLSERAAAVLARHARVAEDDDRRVLHADDDA